MGIEASAHTTVVDVVGDVVEEDVVEDVEVVDDVDEDDVVDDVQVEDGVVESTADAGAIRYGPKNSRAMTVDIATKRIFFMNMTIAISMK